MEEKIRHTVFFIGAGPGDPDLMTIRGRKILEKADVVIYTGSLVPSVLIDGLDSEIHDSAGLDLEQVMDLVIGNWKLSRRVVRLHTGDPSIYGAIREQMDILDKNDIPFEVVPGVSSVTAAAAALKKELTLPGISQTIIITRLSGRTPVPEKENLKSLASHQATMIIMLSVSMIAMVVRELEEGGYSENTPVAVVEKVSWPEERIMRGTISTITGLVRTAGINRTAIIAVGDVFRDMPVTELSRLYDRNFGHGFRDGLSSSR